MIAPDKVSACLVTRGDCDMQPIIDSLISQGILDIVIWDNSIREDMGIYGRYAAIAEAKNKVIVTQDDDVIVSDYKAILKAYEPGKLTVNYPEPYDVPWPSAGSVFDRGLPQLAFDRYFQAWPNDRLFTHRICDAIFSMLSIYIVIDVGYEDLPHGFHAGRVSTGEGWYDRDRPEARRRAHDLLLQQKLYGKKVSA